MSSVILDVLLLCLLFPCIAHFHFIIVIFFYWNLAVFITCYWNTKLTYLLTFTVFARLNAEWELYGAREGACRKKFISCARDAISFARDNFFLCMSLRGLLRIMWKSMHMQCFCHCLLYWPSALPWTPLEARKTVAISTDCGQPAEANKCLFPKVVTWLWVWRHESDLRQIYML